MSEQKMGRTGRLLAWLAGAYIGRLTPEKRVAFIKRAYADDYCGDCGEPLTNNHGQTCRAFL